jgi:putative addiction module killer protein
MELKLYKTANGKYPFEEWFISKDSQTKAKIFNKLDQLEQGQFSNCKPVGENVFERKLYGIRLYFLKTQNVYIFLLAGGEKDKQQQKDIDKAKEYAKDFYNRYTQKDIEKERTL